MSRFRTLKPPQLLRCKCGHTVEVTDCSQWPAAKAKRSPCPECGSLMTMRCGAGRKKARMELPGGDHNCHARASPGSRCVDHGRDSVKGVEHYAYAHGEKSAYAPKRYARDFEEKLVDSDVQRSQRRELAVYDGVVQDALARLDTGESGEAWAKLQGSARSMRKRLGAIKRAGAEGNAERASELAAGLLEGLETGLLPLIDNGVDEEAGRAEVAKLLVDRTKLTDAALRAEQSMPMAAARIYKSQLVASVQMFLESDQAIRMLGEHFRTPDQVAMFKHHLDAILPDDDRNGREVKVVGPGT